MYDHEIFGQQRYGGISRYFCELATRVANSPGWRARVVAPVHFNDHLAQCSAPRLGLYIRQRSVESARLYRAVNKLIAPPLLRACRADLVHRTYYAAHPQPPRGQLVITIFDMIHELFPQSFRKDDPVHERKRRCVEAADRLICISHSTARDLQRLCDVPAHKIVVTHLGFSSAFSQVASPPAPANRRPYLLYVGHRDGYKNFGRVLQAYAASARLRADFSLLAFGGLPFGAGERERIAQLGLSSEQVRHQSGSDAELARVYAGAHLFVYPSEYEGFGIPPLEAMSCGCAVVCSNTSSLPEVVDKAGEYFSPTSVDAVREALEHVSYDDQRRAALIAAGRRQVERFTWERCAQETLEVYRAALGRS